MPQGGFDGEIGILELPAPPADARRCPRGDRVGREPEGDVASPHEGSVYSAQFPTRYVVVYFGCTLDFTSRS